jgi:hypothetical protein
MWDIGTLDAREVTELATQQYVSERFSRELPHNFLSCAYPYWCFMYADECGGNRAVIIGNGNEI